MNKTCFKRVERNRVEIKLLDFDFGGFDQKKQKKSGKKLGKPKINNKNKKKQKKIKKKHGRRGFSSNG